MRHNKEREFNKKNLFKRWLKRLLFLVLLFLFFLQFNHIALAIDALQQIDNDQINTMNQMSQTIHSLEKTNANLQVQLDMMKVKINHVEIVNNQLNNPVIHNEQPQETHTYHMNTYNVSSLLRPASLAATAAGVLYTLYKMVLNPVLP